jgi:rhodanese-related sulfurtransferase
MKKIFATACMLALVAFSALAAKYPDIKIDDLKSAISAKNVTVIDVNGTDSYKEGHIPGALNFDAVKAHLAKVLPKDKNALVVAYCGGPQCQAYQAAAKAAKELGYKNVKHLSAGISGWRAAGEKLERGS